MDVLLKVKNHTEQEMLRLYLNYLQQQEQLQLDYTKLL